MNLMQAAARESVSPEAFRRTCSRYATGIAIATVSAEDGTPAGLTVNSFTSVSCCPPLVLICIDYRCSILPLFRASSYYGINVLDQSQCDLSVRFAQRDPAGFQGLDWYRSPAGAPLIRPCLASLECCVTQTVEAGDHAILVAEVTAAECRDGQPLVYFGSQYRFLSDSGK